MLRIMLECKTEVNVSQRCNDLIVVATVQICIWTETPLLRKEVGLKKGKAIDVLQDNSSAEHY